MTTFLTADFHLGETRLETLNRPFTDTTEMAEVLIENHNAVVAKNDLVYVVGDVLWKGADPNKWMPFIDRFNGRKTLIRGNQDRPFTDEQFSKYFERIVPEGDGIELDIEGLPCYITHYPTRGRKDRFTICGHVHSAWRIQKNAFNCGLDANHFRPTSAAGVLKVYDSICTFYDEDAWVAYNEINTTHMDRGRKGSYFNGR